MLVILGLLVGGVLSGQSLIRAAELRAVSSEYSRYVAATYSFRDKYFAFPGDMTNATQFWGRQQNTPDCPTNSSAAQISTGVCDGNGDGTIVWAGLTFAASTPQEPFQFWRQLALAGLLEGTFSGISGSASYVESVVAVNTPSGKMSNSRWESNSWNNSAGGNAIAYAIDYDRGFRFSGISNWQLLSPSEAWNVDTKIDDGAPAKGKVIALGYNNTCASAIDGTSEDNDFNASYRLTDNSKQCGLYFTKVF